MCEMLNELANKCQYYAISQLLCSRYLEVSPLHPKTITLL